ncbi:PEP-CTERM sorting domain-containing protein [Desulfobacter sp. UBA2225]|uniref:PEP-CTERM sorting domain-containing protein n=1 Tax=Desulfobacter sp. UBA2225 TaxID=1961413 RepID=UPI00257C11A0|nr:PEP-CTERM sorting domain-containing protein [Desulfobacter sp. UBA2225]
MKQNVSSNLKKYTCQGLAALGILAACCQTANAASLFPAADGWTQIANDDGSISPGVGGQTFDAEYLAYKLVGNTLFVGLQAGFDLVDGHVKYTDNKDYYAGDLALSFDGNASTYEYAFDFGLFTKDYYNGELVEADNNADGKDDFGLYSVTEWNDDIAFTTSNPFAMDGGTMVSGANGTTAAGQDGTSYWRTVSFDLTSLGLTGIFTLDAHWTMSCGNDAINGSADVPVPEPATMLLFGTGLMGLAGLQRRRMNKE